MPKQPILLIGGGGHCKACIDVIEHEGKFEIYGIVDREERTGEKVLGYPIIASDEALPSLVKTLPNALITVGQISSPEIRQKLFDQLKSLGFSLPIVRSPLAYVSKHALVGEGTIIMHHALVNAAAEVGKNCIINSKALIEHDANIGDHCHISTGAVINGGVTIQTGTFFGSNATSKEYVSSAENDFIKAHSIYKGRQ